MKIGEPFKVFGGAAVRALPLSKWKRPNGRSSFVQDMIELRKTLVLCRFCEFGMPRRWTSRYNYAFVKGFHADGTACDRCRVHAPTNMYCAVDGAYHREIALAQRSVREVKARERAAFDRDRRYFIGW